jgi:hypothetical protein
MHVTRTEVVRNQCKRTIQTKYVQKYISHKLRPDPLMVGIIAVLERTPQLQQFWCANSKKNPNIDREIKYLDFVSGHLASTETQRPKKRSGDQIDSGCF